MEQIECSTLALNIKNMKAVFIAMSQAHYRTVVDEMLAKMNIRGFTSWKGVSGRGSRTGEPHYGSHAWPALNNAVITIVDDHKVKPLLEYLKVLDADYENLGLRAFVWNIEDGI